MKKSGDYIDVWLVLLGGALVAFITAAVFLSSVSHAQPREVRMADKITVSAIVRGLEVRDAEVTIVTKPTRMLQATPLKQADLYNPTVQLEVR